MSILVLYAFTRTLKVCTLYTLNDARLFAFQEWQLIQGFEV